MSRSPGPVPAVLRPRLAAAVATFTTVATLAVALLAAAPAAACEVCFGARDSDSPLVAGAQLGVFLLLGITVVLLAGFAGFFFYLRHRAQRVGSDRLDAEWAQLQRSGST
jgi:hypothetical protein